MISFSPCVPTRSTTFVQDYLVERIHLQSTGQGSMFKVSREFFFLFLPFDAAAFSYFYVVLGLCRLRCPFLHAHKPQAQEPVRSSSGIQYNELSNVLAGCHCTHYIHCHTEKQLAGHRIIITILVAIMENLEQYILATSLTDSLKIEQIIFVSLYIQF